MKARLFIHSVALLLPLCLTIAALGQDNTIETQSAKVIANLSAQGFTCRVEKTGKAADKIELKLQMSKDVLYYIAAVTGRGETAVHPTKVTLINQNKRVIPMEVQNLEFGSVLQLHPLSDGLKTLAFVMKQKTDYALEVCTHKASLFHTEEKNAAFDDHGHF